METCNRPVPATALRSADLVPATFADRGVAVSFTTPGLSQARVRRNQRDLLELLVPDFAKSDGIYVMPWKLVPETISMTLHDRSLYELISSRPGVTPWEIRRLQAETGASGLAGPEVAELCARALREDDRQRWSANFGLIRRMFDHIGMDGDSLVADKFLAPATQGRVKRAFHEFAGQIGLAPSECYAAIAEHSECLAPVGLPAPAQPGRLRCILDQLRTMALSMEGWSALVPRRIAEKVRAVLQVIEVTTLAAHEDLRRIDARSADIAAMVKDWRAGASALRETVTHLYWLLDGWEHIAATWLLAVEESELAAIEAVEEMRRILPYLPRMECESLPIVRDTTLLLLGDRRIKAMEDWRTRRLDFELVRRIEAVKSIAL